MTPGLLVAAGFQFGDAWGWITGIVVALLSGGGGVALFTRRRDAKKLEQDGDRLQLDAFTAVSTLQNTRDATLVEEANALRGSVATLTQKMIDFGTEISNLRAEKDQQLDDLRREKNAELEDLRGQLRDLRATNEAKSREVAQLLVDLGQFKDAVRNMVDELRLQWGRGGAFPEIVTRNNHLLDALRPPDGG